MIRMRPFCRSVKHTSSSRFQDRVPHNYLPFLGGGWCSSGKIDAKASSNTVVASSNVIPCFRRFRLAFWASHSKTRSIPGLLPSYGCCEMSYPTMTCEPSGIRTPIVTDSLDLAMNANQNSTPRELLCCARAYKTFRFAAWYMVPLALIFVVALTPIYGTITARGPTQVAFQVIGGSLGVLGALTGMVIFLGMTAYLLLLDRSSPKLLWLGMFLLAGCFGTSIYSLAVYRRQTTPRSRTVR